MPTRIAVLGAGLAGLAAATQLTRVGFDVTVYEARNRAGGRVWSSTLHAAGSEHVIERGAEFVLGGYDVLRRYCGELGLELVDTGMSYYVRVPADMPDVTTEDVAALGKVAAEAARGGSGPRSVADVLTQIGATGAVRETLEARIEMSTSVRVDQVTADQTLDHVASFRPQPSWRIGGGNQQLPNGLARSLGDRVRLGTRVREVVQSGDAVTVRTEESSDTYDFVVVALPFGIVTDSAAMSIALPEWKLEAISRVVQGNAAKIHLALEDVPETSAVMSVTNRYWTWTANELGGAVAPVLNGFGGELGHLKALHTDQDASVWEEHVRGLRDDLPFATSRAIVTAWPFDPLAAGAYTAHAPGFSSADADALAAPHGRMFFAGEYIDREFTGLMEGALRSGDRAARAVITAAAEAVAA